VSRLLRLIVGLGLTALAFWLANPAAVLHAGASADPRWLLAAVLLVIPDRALMAYRWVVLLRAVDRAKQVPLTAILRVFFVSTFVGTFLPSIGGDAARAYGLSRHDISVADSAASVVMDRLLGAWSLLLFAFGGLTLTGVARHDAGVLTALAVTTAGCAAAALALYSDSAARALKRLIALLPFAAVRRSSDRLFEAIRRYGRHHGVVANVTIGSLAVQALRILQAYCLGRGAVGVVLRADSVDAARHARADQRERPGHQPGRVRLSLRVGRCAARAIVRAVDSLYRARRRGESAGRLDLRIRIRQSHTGRPGIPPVARTSHGAGGILSHRSR
jgi:uncharacterized membrane protein YbhN (UPF0104 family)